MNTKVLLITPPFTQLNTPYPATAYIKGFLNTKKIDSYQVDLGIEVILKLFSKSGLTHIFETVELNSNLNELTDNSIRIYSLRADYIKTIDPVICFLQGENPTLALQISQEDFLPEASRFSQLEELDWAFGSMGTQDKAKHLATLYLEDLSDFIVENIDPHFGFSRYAERLGRSAYLFDELYFNLNQQHSYIDAVLIELLDDKIKTFSPELVLLSVPFPGNLYSAFRCGQYIKSEYTDIKIAMGGGFPNTELRSLSDTRVFEFLDFICLDDGERPIENLIQFLNLTRNRDALKRTFLLEDDKVVYVNNPLEIDYKQSEVGTPDYTDLQLDQYISVIEIVNPMHRMWSDGRWNKLTMAHGCYWGKCTFCDISLDYIKLYEPVTAKLLCDRMEEMLLKTGTSGFHFVDEAAPPSLMKALAIEILKRKLIVTWWTNIRFEKSFTSDLCQLLRASGCIAVSGGLEVASDRLLKLIDKGVSVEQVAQVTLNFSQAGIMVHAYMMYGYPTQTVQETVDSLEMVRQLFEAGVLQSGFWHQFALTAHSPVGLHPEQFGIEITTPTIGSFANNDLDFVDKTGINHDQFSYGLKKSLFNFMHGIGFDFNLQEWFDFKIPRTKIQSDFIENALNISESFILKPNAKLIWLGTQPNADVIIKSKKGTTNELLKLTFHDKKNEFTIQFERKIGEWLVIVLQKIDINQLKTISIQELKIDFETQFDDFELFWFSKSITKLKENGLLVL